MSEIIYRPAIDDDLPRLVEIYNEVISEGGFTADLELYTLEQRRGWFEAHRDPPFLIYVVETNHAVVGYFYFSPWRSGRAALRRVAEVSYYLAKEARGRGVGRAMLREAETIAQAAGLNYLIAILIESNSASRALLEKGGFSRAGLFPEIADLGERMCGQLLMFKRLT